MCKPVVIMSPDLSQDKKRKQRSNEDFVSPTRLYSIKPESIMRKFMPTMTNANCGLWGPFPLNITPNSLPALRQTKNLSHIRTEEKKTRSLIYKVNLNFLCSSRISNCDTVLFVILSSLKESVNGFHITGNGTVKTGLQIVYIKGF